MNILKKLGKSVSTVGLDIGSHAVKLAKVNHSKNNCVLEAVGIKELKPGIIENGNIKDKAALLESIITLINQCDPSIVDVVLSLSGHGILTEKFNFKIESNDAIEETILWEAGQRSPFDVDDITLDYKIIREYPEKKEIEVLIVAAKNKIMQEYIDLLYEAGLKPTVVEVDAFAINNCYALESVAESHAGTIALLNIGHSLTSITFIKDGLYHSTRYIATAGDFFCKTIHRNLNVPEAEAMDILKGVVKSKGDQNILQRSIEYSMEELSSGIDLAFSYFKNSEKSERIDKIILTGGGAYIPNIKKFLEERHNTNVSPLNPFAFMKYDASLFGSVNPQKISAFMTVAIGLGLRKVKMS